MRSALLPVPACLYAVALQVGTPGGESAMICNVYSGASEAEALGAALLEWRDNYREEHPFLGGFVISPADYDQLAYIVAQCEEDGAA